MNTPSLEKLIEKVDSRYTLVVAAAKRARQIIAQNNQAEETSEEEDRTTGAVSMALEDILHGRTVPVQQSYEE